MPKQDSWASMAEIELGYLQRQYLDRRMADMTTLQTDVADWQRTSNVKPVKVHW